GTRTLRLPPLAVAMGLYLPPSIVTALFVGALIAWFIGRRTQARALASGTDPAAALEKADRRATLFASGLIVGESLVGVVLAMIIVVSVSAGGSASPLALPGLAGLAGVLGPIAFAAMCVIFARRVLRRD